MAETMRSAVGAIAMAWFRSDEWDKLKTVCDGLQDTYEEWLANAHAVIEGAGLTENDIEKVILTFDDLRDWKHARGRKIKGSERAKLAAKIANERAGTHH